MIKWYYNFIWNPFSSSKSKTSGNLKNKELRESSFYINLYLNLWLFLCNSFSGNGIRVSKVMNSGVRPRILFPYPSTFSPQFVVVHTIKGFGIVNKAEIDVFLELSCFWMIQQMLAIWSLVPLPFLNPAWTSGSSRFMYYWNLAWRIFSITLLACEMSATDEPSLALPFFGIGMKTDLFESCGHWWVF